MDSKSGDELFKKVYAHLRAIAAKMLRREKPGHTLQPTAIVNEAYLRMAKQLKQKFDSQVHFMKFASTVIRHVLVDHARAAKAAKRPGRGDRVDLNSGFGYTPKSPEGLLELDIALERLRKVNPRQADIVEMHFFGGMSLDEIADALGISRRTVAREWNAARAWLFAELNRPRNPPSRHDDTT